MFETTRGIVQRTCRRQINHMGGVEKYGIWNIKYL